MPKNKEKDEAILRVKLRLPEDCELIEHLDGYRSWQRANEVRRLIKLGFACKKIQVTPEFIEYLVQNTRVGDSNNSTSIATPQLQQPRVKAVGVGDEVEEIVVGCGQEENTTCQPQASQEVKKEKDNGGDEGRGSFPIKKIPGFSSLASLVDKD